MAAGTCTSSTRSTRSSTPSDLWPDADAAIENALGVLKPSLCQCVASGHGVVLGGPLGDPDYGPALLVFAAEHEDDVRRHLADDPWTDTILTVERIERWSIWVGSLPVGIPHRRRGRASPSPLSDRHASEELLAQGSGAATGQPARFPGDVAEPVFAAAR